MPLRRSRRRSQIRSNVEDHQGNRRGFGHHATVCKRQGRHLTQRVYLFEAVALRARLVKALNVDKIVRDIGQRQHQFANCRPPAGYAIDGDHVLRPREFAAQERGGGRFSHVAV